MACPHAKGGSKVVSRNVHVACTHLFLRYVCEYCVSLIETEL